MSLFHADPKSSTSFFICYLNFLSPPIKTKCLEFRDISYLSLYSTAQCHCQTDKQSWRTTSCHCFRGTGIEHQDKVALQQTAATPSQGDMYWSIKPLGDNSSRVSQPPFLSQVQGLLDQFYSANQCGFCASTYPPFCRGFLGFFRQSLSATEADNPRVLQEAACSDFKGIPRMLENENHLSHGFQASSS